MCSGLSSRDGFGSPIDRGCQHLFRFGLRSTGLHWNRYLGHRVFHGIEDRQKVRAILMNPIDEAVGIGIWISSVDRDFIMEIVLRSGPVPLCDDDVSLHSLRTRRNRGQFAGFYAVGPIGIHLQSTLPAHLCRAGAHRATDLTRLDAPIPRCYRCVECAEIRGYLARRLVAQLVAPLAAISLGQFNPLALVPNAF